MSKSTKQEAVNQQSREQLTPREIPFWSGNEQLEMNGLEFETIFNAMNAMSQGFQAAQSIMQKNIFNGKIKMRFEKPVETKDENGNVTGVTYETMTDEEQAPLIENFNKMIGQMKKMEAVKNDPEALKALVEESKEMAGAQA